MHTDRLIQLVAVFATYSQVKIVIKMKYIQGKKTGHFSLAALFAKLRPTM